MRLKSIITLICVAAACNAWSQDSARVARPPQAAPVVDPPASQQYTQPTEYRIEEMDKIEIDRLPPVLREALRDPIYEGWERSNIYHDRTTGEYIMQMQNARTVPPTGGVPIQTAPQTFRFDKNGKAINIDPFNDDDDNKRD